MPKALSLYFMRHAEAGEHDPRRWPDDSKRPLTDEGVDQARRAAKGLRAAGLRVTKIVSSPYVRARQTAEAAAKELRYEGKIDLTRALEPDGDFERLEDVLLEFDEGDQVLLTGHEPSISYFVSRLLIDDEGLPIQFSKAAVCRLDVVDRKALKTSLRWFLTPKIARKIRKK